MLLKILLKLEAVTKSMERDDLQELVKGPVLAVTSIDLSLNIKNIKRPNPLLLILF